MKRVKTKIKHNYYRLRYWDDGGYTWSHLTSGTDMAQIFRQVFNLEKSFKVEEGKIYTKQITNSKCTAIKQYYFCISTL